MTINIYDNEKVQYSFSASNFILSRKEEKELQNFLDVLSATLPYHSHIELKMHYKNQKIYCDIIFNSHFSEYRKTISARNIGIIKKNVKEEIKHEIQAWQVFRKEKISQYEQFA